jgi:pathogenesis-related protein 1
MEIRMKRIIVVCLVLTAACFLLFSTLSAYDSASVDRVYKYLSQKWSYYDIDGNKITVSSLSWRSSGSNAEVIVNGRSLDPSTVYDGTGQNIVDPSKRNKAQPKVIIGAEKGSMKGITEAHNKFRRKTGSGLPELVWDDEVAAYAQRWADHLKSTNGCSMQHRRGSSREKSYGENLAWASGKELEPEDVVQMWYDEIKYYNYASNSCSGVCGHYTQVIWRDSKKVGCGMAKCGRSEVWVCNYDPPGNWVGRKPY